MPMKITLQAFFFLSLAFALSTAFARKNPAINSAPVLDTDGNPVINGGLYLILPAPPATGGGFVPSALDGETCPVSVVQSPSGNGFSLFIQLVSSQLDEYVHPTDPVDIIFAGRPVCTDSAKWIVKFSSPVPAVFIGEVDDRTIDGYFRIEKYEEAYKLVFSPDRIPGVSWDLGISPYGNPRLVTNQENPFKFVIRSLNRRNSMSIV